MNESTDKTVESSEPSRRSFLFAASSVVTGGFLLAGYGTFAGYACRYLYPARGSTKGWLFVGIVDLIKPGDSLPYVTPSGSAVTIARQGDAGTVDDFIALSSTCPHLGCKVHWEGQNDRFFCPCHNGVFDRDGQGTGGPPGDAGQTLYRYPLKIENGLLMIEVSLQSLTT